MFKRMCLKLARRLLCIVVGLLCVLALRTAAAGQHILCSDRGCDEDTALFASHASVDATLSQSTYAKSISWQEMIGAKAPSTDVRFVLDDFDRPDGSLGTNWDIEAGWFKIADQAAVGGDHAIAIFNGVSGNIVEGDISVVQPILDYTGFVLNYGPGVSNIFVKAQSSNPPGKFVKLYCYQGNNGARPGVSDWFDLDPPFAAAHMKVAVDSSRAVLVEFSNVDGGAEIQHYACTPYPSPEGIGVGIVGYSGLASMDNFAVSTGEGPEYSLSGLVTDDSSRPISDVTIHSVSFDNATTNANGVFYVYGLAAGTYTITPTLSSYRFAPIDRTIIIPSTKPVTFTARPAVPERFLDLPVDYSGTSFSLAAQGYYDENPDGRVNSWFDHSYPTYYLRPNGQGYEGSENGDLTRWDGICFYELLSSFEQGISWYDGHNGLDFRPKNRSAPDDDIFAAAAGTVFGTTLSSTGYGNRVWVDHHNGYATLYGHLSEVSVTDGMTITSDTKARRLGVMGDTGNSKGPHLHFGVYYDQNGDGKWTKDEVVDPYGGPDTWSVPSFPLWLHPLSWEDTLGPEGGSAASPSGDVACDIPPGALAISTTVEVWDSSPPAPALLPLRSVGRSFRIRLPDWLSGSTVGSASVLPSFSLPITLTIQYPEVSPTHLDRNALGVHCWDDDSGSWAQLESQVDPIAHRVTVQTDKTGWFDLQAPLLCPLDTAEPDDNYLRASLVEQNGEPKTHVFDISQDEDWFRISAASGTQYTIRTGNLAAGVDTIVEVYSVDATAVLASDDDGGPGRSSYLVWETPADGTYFVRVLQGAGSAYGCTSSYDLMVSGSHNTFLPIVLRNP